MKRICQILGAVLMASGLGPAGASDDPPPACMSVGGGGTQFSSTCDGCVVTDGSATIDRDESTYGTLEIVTAGSGTMRATAPSGVVFPAGSSAAILSSIDFSGDVAMSLRTYAGSVLQEEFVIDLDEHPYYWGPDGRSLVAFRTTRQYDAVEFSVSQLDPSMAPPYVCQPYGMPCVGGPTPRRVTARIHEFCSGPDMTPDAFAFSEQAGVERGTLVTSAPVTITGIEAPVSISVSGSGYSIGCTETFTVAAGSISNGETVCVRHYAAWEFGGHMHTTLTVGGVSGVFTSRTRAADGTPGAFTFSDQAGVEPGAQVTSAPVTISGIEEAVPVFISDGAYSIGCTASYTAAQGSISDGQTVCVRHTAAGFGGSASTTLTVGNISDTFTSTTRAADVTPAAFSFTDQGGVEPGATVTSAAVTITGIEAPAPISVSGGEYSIGCTATFTPASGTIANDQTVCVRHTSAATHGTATDTTLTVGGISDTFTSTTAAAPAEPPTPAEGGAGGGAPSPWLVGVLAAVATLRRWRSADPGSAATEELRRGMG